MTVVIWVQNIFGSIEGVRRRGGPGKAYHGGVGLRVVKMQGEVFQRQDEKFQIKQTNQTPKNTLAHCGGTERRRGALGTA